MIAGTPNVLVAGPAGVTGSAITARLAASERWSLATASRRPAAEAPVPDRHVSVDLLDPASSAGLGTLTTITHLVYAAYVERPTMAETTGPNVAMLTHTLDALTSAGAPLEHVILIGGGKSYGEHLGPYKTPAKESDPRFLGPIFYNDQEDLVAERGARDGFTFTVLRPDLVMGVGLGSPMSLLTTLGVYAALSRDAGVPLRFPGAPGAWTALHQSTDADLLASAVLWALTADTARDEVFNVVNGDQFRWQHLWPEIAEVFDLPTAAPQPMSLTAQMAGKEAAWDALVRRHDLRPTPYGQIAGWSFADGVWNSAYDMVQSTIKIRQAGFADSVDTHRSVIGKLRWLRRQHYLP